MKVTKVLAIEESFSTGDETYRQAHFTSNVYKAYGLVVAFPQKKPLLAILSD